MSEVTLILILHMGITKLTESSMNIQKATAM